MQCVFCEVGLKICKIFLYFFDGELVMLLTCILASAIL